MKTKPPYSRIQSTRSTWNPIRSLTPENLSRMLDAFHAGHLRPAALVWEAIEHRDDLLQGVISKRKKSISRLKWEILTLDNSPEAQSEKIALEFFYNNLTTVNAYNEHEKGGFSLLVKQMMDAVGKKYAIHEVIFRPVENDIGGLSGSLSHKLLTAEFRFVPLWFLKIRTVNYTLFPKKSRLVPFV